MIAVEDRLAHVEAELRELRAENDQLRRSALAFGELAERLNHALIRATISRHDPAPRSNVNITAGDSIPPIEPYRRIASGLSRSVRTHASRHPS